MMQLSILDLAPVCEGSDTTQAFANMLDLAQHAEGWGFHRYWLAEHHNMPGIASAATAVLIGHVAGGTKRIRVGAGGIMLPNHSPLQVAEQFGTLASLYPDRIDLGLGRAPGTDQPTARALRRYFDSADQFPQDVRELLHYFEPAQKGQAVRAVPGARPSPTSMRSGYSDARVPNCSATCSGAWLGSITPPAPTRIRWVPPATCPISTAVAALAMPGMLWCSASQ